MKPKTVTLAMLRKAVPEWLVIEEEWRANYRISANESQTPESREVIVWHPKPALARRAALAALTAMKGGDRG
jgi:hypothetical protein